MRIGNFLFILALGVGFALYGYCQEPLPSDNVLGVLQRVLGEFQFESNEASSLIIFRSTAGPEIRLEDERRGPEVNSYYLVLMPDEEFTKELLRQNMAACVPARFFGQFSRAVFMTEDDADVTKQAIELSEHAVRIGVTEGTDTVKWASEENWNEKESNDAVISEESSSGDSPVAARMREILSSFGYPSCLEYKATVAVGNGISVAAKQVIGELPVVSSYVYARLDSQLRLRSILVGLVGCSLDNVVVIGRDDAFSIAKSWYARDNQDCALVQLRVREGIALWIPEDTAEEPVVVCTMCPDGNRVAKAYFVFEFSCPTVSSGNGSLTFETEEVFVDAETGAISRDEDLVICP